MNETVRTLPAEFLEILSGLPELGDLATTLMATAPEVSVREAPPIPSLKGGAANFVAPPLGGGSGGAAGANVPWCPEGRYLDVRPQFTMDPAMHQGRYYVQDASSMFISHVVRQLTCDGAPRVYLDACAAPGGKATAALDALPAGSLLVANEYVPKRAQILTENISKWGREETVVTQGDTARLGRLHDTFDIVAVDAPCSGEGMMRKEPVAVEQWSPRLVEECAARQREIIGNLWGAVREGGHIIYSTCTFNRRENEEVLEWMVEELGAEPVSVDIDSAWGILPGVRTPYPCYRFIPGRVRGEGLFMAVVRKPERGGALAPRAQVVERKPERGGALAPRAQAVERKPERGGALAPRAQAVERKPERGGALAPRTQAVERKPISKLTEDPYFPKEYLPVLKCVQKVTKVVQYGIQTAVTAGKALAPTQQLALARRLDRGLFPECDVDRETALRYLHGEALTLPDETPRGYVLLTYEAHPLGFVKNLGNRANNLYPAPWRIRKQI